MNTSTRILSGTLCCLVAAWAAAETVYVTSQFKVGLHEDKSGDSPIVKVIPSGTALELVKRGDTASYVREADGTGGWLDNSYLTGDAPADDQQIRQLRKQLSDAQQRISDLQAQSGTGAAAPDQQSTLQKKNADLEQQLKEEQLRAGEFQIKLAELRKRVGQNSDNASLYKRIEQLEADKKKLEVQLSGRPAANDTAPLLTGSTPGSGMTLDLRLSTLAIVAGVILLGGFIGGVYLMDYLNRRKHGGFRV